MVSSGLVLMKIGWEYDDEYYSRQDEGTGKPIRVYTDKRKADAECERLNAEFLKEQEANHGHPMESYDGPVTAKYEVVPADVEFGP